MDTATSNDNGAAGSWGEPRYTPLVEDLRKTFDTGLTRPLVWRERQLEGLVRLIEENEEALCAALAQDVGKPAVEAGWAELSTTAAHITHVRKRLRRWAKPEKVGTPLVFKPMRATVQSEPLGTVLIVSPWNFPVLLTLNPLAGALAAGNCAVVKPSELSPATSACLAELLPRYVDAQAVRVVQGGVEETTALLRERFDHILYTGSGRVGRIVMEAAARHLTPVTLELGGKCPVLVDAGVDVELVAPRLLSAKLFNCGQACVAPDYALVHADVYDALVAALKTQIEAFYGSDPQRSPDYARIVNARHHARLMALLEGQPLLHGGRSDAADRYLEPTLLGDVDPASPLMQEEIFGPVLPMLRVQDMSSALSFVRARPKPLAAYLYSNDRALQQRMEDTTSSGALVCNAGYLHMLVPDLPFGGVGDSGMGAYHGKASFDTFSHRKAVVRKPLGRDPNFIYPPFTDKKRRWLDRLL